jgi:hypothetical protein
MINLARPVATPRAVFYYFCRSVLARDRSSQLPLLPP